MHIPEYFPHKLPYFYSFKLTKQAGFGAEEWTITRHFKDGSPAKPCFTFSVDMLTGEFKVSGSGFLSMGIREHFTKYRLKIEEEKASPSTEGWHTKQAAKAVSFGTPYGPPLYTTIPLLPVDVTGSMDALWKFPTFDPDYSKIETGYLEKYKDALAANWWLDWKKKSDSQISDFHFGHLVHDEITLIPKGTATTPELPPQIIAAPAAPIPAPEPPLSCPICAAKVVAFDLFGCVKCR